MTCRPTWPAALRGVVRGLRAALAAIGAGGQLVIATTPAGLSRSPPGSRWTSAPRAAAVRAAGAADRAGQAPGRDGGGDAGSPRWPATSCCPARTPPGSNRTAGSSTRRRCGRSSWSPRRPARLGDHHQAVAARRRAVAAYPLDERAHRALISALHQAGDRAGAVRAYEHCRSLLAEQLGVDPGRRPSRSTWPRWASRARRRRPGCPRRRQRSSAGQPSWRAWRTLIGAPGLVTVAGLGGVGKSRLVTQVAARVRGVPGWPAVGVARAGGGGRAGRVHGRAGARRPGRRRGSDGALAATLAPLGRALLVLDGCEAVVDGAASLVDRAAVACPMLTVVVTSRVPLSVDGERVLALGPLPGPAGPGRTALRASLPGAAARRPGPRAAAVSWRSTRPTAPLVAALCRRCGGLPLALELAAAQLAAMSVADLLDHLPEVLADGEDRLRAIARRQLRAAATTTRPRSSAGSACWTGRSTLPLVRAGGGRRRRSRRSGWCGSCGS